MKTSIRRSASALFIASLAFGPACNCNKAAINSSGGHLVVVPDQVIFTPIPTGKTETIALQVSNAGGLPLHLASLPVAVGANGSGALTDVTLTDILTTDCTGGGMRAAADILTFSPGECALINVVYSRTHSTAPDGYIDFLSDDPVQPEVKIPVSLGPPATLKVCTLKSDGTVDSCDATDGTPPTLNFGTTNKGTAVQKKLRLTNAGTILITGLTLDAISGTNAGEFSGPTAMPQTSLAAGASADLTFSFNPTATGTRAATIAINSNDSTREPILVPFTGIGAGPAICASPSPVEFGNVGTGQTSTKTLTLTSCGTVAVNLLTMMFDIFSSPDFAHPQPFPAPQSLAPGATLSIDLTLKPIAVGDESGVLDIPNDGNQGQYVKLHGTAVQTPSCHLSPAQNPIDFGQVAANMSREKDATVANAGTLDCHLTSAVVAGANFSITNAPVASITLRPGDVYTVQATYAVPAGDANAQDKGTITWASDDPANPSLVVNLTGEPVAAPLCKLSVTPTAHGIAGFSQRTLVFGNVVVGHDKILPITLTNTGSADCNITAWKFVNQFIIDPTGGTCASSHCDDYTFATPPPSSPLHPGQSTQVNVKFAPSNTNQIPIGPTDFVQVQTSDSSVASSAECIWGFPPNSNTGCFQVGLSGQGDVSNLQVLPADLNFGLVTLGCKTQTENITLYNTGASAPIHITSITLDPMVSPEPFYVVAPPASTAAPLVLAAGARVTIQVTYKPSSASVETASLLIASDASNATSSNPYVTVALSGQGTTDKHQTDTFTQTLLPQVDLLWVIDDSSSFQDYQTALSQQAPAFIANAQNPDGSWKADFHIGVIGNEADMTDKADNYSAYQGDSIYVGGLFGHPSIIDSNTPGAGAAFAKNIKIGTCCSDARESDAEALWDSLKTPTDMTAPPVGSQGFLRDGARLVMVVVTDEIDQSHNNTAFYIDFFKQIKGQYNAGLVSFNAITGDDPNGCSANGVTADANPFDVAIINGVGGKFWSLCTADWAQIANDLSLGAFQGRVQFPLSRVADPATIVVKMNGMAQTAPANYRFDQPSNSIIFVTPPPAGATIVVDYDALCF